MKNNKAEDVSQSLSSRQSGSLFLPKTCQTLKKGLIKGNHPKRINQKQTFSLTASVEIKTICWIPKTWQVLIKSDWHVRRNQKSIYNLANHFYQMGTFAMTLFQVGWCWLGNGLDFFSFFFWLAAEWPSRAGKVSDSLLGPQAICLWSYFSRGDVWPFSA